MTNSILRPGYLRWDGTKYVLDPSVTPTLAGPAGGDLGGTYPNPLVQTLSGDGNNPIHINSRLLTWRANPPGFSVLGLNAEPSVTGAGIPFAVIGQNAQTGSNADGGGVVVVGGSPDGSGQPGAVGIFTYHGISGLQVQDSVNDLISLGPAPSQSGYVRLSNNGYVAARNFAGTQDINLIGIDASNNIIVGGSNTAVLGAGANITIISQAAQVGSNANGGNIGIEGGSGDGTGLLGNVFITGNEVITECLIGVFEGENSLTFFSNNPVDLNVPSLSFNTSIAAPSITQAVNASSGGQNLTISAQSAGGSNNDGGTLNLTGGAATGSGTTGNVLLSTGDNLVQLFLNSLGMSFVAPTLTIYSTTVQFGQSIANPTITQAIASGAAQSMTITGQSAGGTNQGGYLILGGGQHSGSGKSDGVTWVATSFNMGYIEITPSNGANNLNASQSDSNMLRLLAGATGIFTVTLTRAIVDNSLLFVRNETSQTATISYLTGGTVTVGTGTSALIVSNGSSLVKLMVGT